MKKLKLNIDELQVESFEISSSSNSLRGTVNGNAPHTQTCQGGTCIPANTCPGGPLPTCVRTCFDGCSIYFCDTNPSDICSDVCPSAPCEPTFGRTC